jgi:hypothetical protein
MAMSRVFCMLLNLSCAAVLLSGSTAQGQNQSRDEKLRSAPKLCGDRYSDLSVSYPAGKREEFGVDKIIRIAKGVLFEKDTGKLDERFPLAAKKVAEKVPNRQFQIRISPDKELTLKRIQAILEKGGRNGQRHSG